MAYLTHSRQLVYVFWVLLLCLFAVSTQAQGTSIIEQDLERIQQATVFIYQADDSINNFTIRCVSTGTLVSRNGLILTNAHSVLRNDICTGNSLIIALSIRLDAAPIPLYRATVVQSDVGLDLALLSITQDIDGRRLDNRTLSLPFVELGDSSTLTLDETLAIVGYTDLADTPVQVVSGTISAFSEEPNGAPTWVKTSATIPGLMSGGGAYNREGQLVGIPTTATATLQSGTQNCQQIQDTNGDGLVSRNDHCVPIGGFINALRPSAFASPLLRAATLGLSMALPSEATSSTSTNTQPQVSRFFFSTSVNEANLPTTIVTSAPTGTMSLYLFFDYSGMTPETTYELRVTTDNIPNPIFSLAPVRWSGGEQGLWYIGSSGQTWVNGVYTFTLFINDVAQNSASIVIGGAPVQEPVVSDIVFGLSNIDGTPLGNGFVLPRGTLASARFIYRNVPEGTEWVARWFYEGAEVFRTPPDVWRDGTNGAKTISIQDSNGLLAGRYRLEIYLTGRLAATSDFIISGSPQGAFPLVFENAYFTTANSITEALTSNPISNFPNGVNTLYALFDWQNIAVGTPWIIRWYVDEELLLERQSRWRLAENGENFTIALEGVNAIPDGTYRVSLQIGNVQLANFESVVGIGQLPIDRLATTDGILLEGRVIDVSTRQGIPNVTVIIISDQFSVADFVWNTSQIFSMATTDRNGRFQLPRLLEISTDTRSVPYSVMIAAQGYKTIQADGFVVDNETPNPLELTINLARE